MKYPDLIKECKKYPKKPNLQKTKKSMIDFIIENIKKSDINISSIK